MQYTKAKPQKPQAVKDVAKVIIREGKSLAAGNLNDPHLHAPTNGWRQASGPRPKNLRSEIRSHLKEGIVPWRYNTRLLAEKITELANPKRTNLLHSQQNISYAVRTLVSMKLIQPVDGHSGSLFRVGWMNGQETFLPIELGQDLLESDKRDLDERLKCMAIWARVASQFLTHVCFTEERWSEIVKYSNWAAKDLEKVMEKHSGPVKRADVLLAEQIEEDSKQIMRKVREQQRDVKTGLMQCPVICKTAIRMRTWLKRRRNEIISPYEKDEKDGETLSQL